MLRSEPVIRIRLRVPPGFIGRVEEARKALFPDDYSGMGVEISSSVCEQELIYIISASHSYVFKLKSVANEVLRLLGMLIEVNALIGDAGECEEKSSLCPAGGSLS